MMPAGHATLIAAQMKFPDAYMSMIRNFGNSLWKSGLPVLDDLYNETYSWPVPEEVKRDDKITGLEDGKYIEVLKQLKPGLTMVIMHCTAPTEVFQHISDSGPVQRRPAGDDGPQV